jgi:hypothetical protein
MKRLAFYGVLTGLAISVWMYVEYIFGFHASQIGRFTGFVALLVTILGLFLGIRAYRNREKAGNINFWEVVFAGLQISLFAGLVTALFAFCYLKFINPGFAEFMVDVNRQYLLDHGASPAQIQGNAQVTRATYVPLPQALRTFGGFMAAGGLFSLILAGLLKSRRMTE